MYRIFKLNPIYLQLKNRLETNVNQKKDGSKYR